MNALIVYATHSGNTYTVSSVLLEKISGVYATKLKTAKELSKLDLDEADIILIGSSSWDWEGKEGYPLKEMMECMDEIGDYDFSTKKIALFGCGDRDFKIFCGAVDMMERFMNDRLAEFICEPLKIDKFYINELENRKQVNDWVDGLLGSLN